VATLGTFIALGWFGEDQMNSKLSLSTTTELLAQRLGHALEKAFQGEVHYGFP